MIPLRALIVDDSEKDAALLLRMLRKAGYDPLDRRVDTAEGLTQALAEQEWDVVLCDYVMPGFGGLAALKIVRDRGLDLPFIVISGQIGEETAVEAMRAGAQDYLMKDRLARLGPTVKREIDEARFRREHLKAVQELKERDEELRLSREGEKLKDDFIGMVSHELKTPLTVIIGALSVAASEDLPREELKELLGDAVDGAGRMAHIVDNLLELARHQSNRLTLHTEQTDMGSVVRSVIWKLQGKSAKHRLVADIPSGIPPVIVDRTRVELVVHNLIENAIKYSPEGGDVRVFAHYGDSHLVVGVSDQGMGIAPKDQAGLFQDFQRVNGFEKNPIPGVGLGLKVCRVLVEAHGGQIWVESAPYQGSTFYFSLPMEKRSRVDSKQQAVDSRQQAVDSKGTPLQHLRRRDACADWIPAFAGMEKRLWILAFAGMARKPE